MGSTRRPVRIANCSGAEPDPGIHMYNQAKYGQVDVITGDYLAGKLTWRNISKMMTY
jgi:hypothetical protein